MSSNAAFIFGNVAFCLALIGGFVALVREVRRGGGSR